ncbi:MAG: TIGR02206 family membrane protein, partial [bacterium]
MASTPGFTLFGSAHLLAMALIGIAGVTLPVWIRRRWSDALARRVARGLALLLVVQELFQIWMQTALYGFPLATRLPLHLCGVAVFLTPVVLVRRTYAVYELVYFWGLGGAVQAILTPELHFGFPHPIFLTFFLGHGLIVVGALYATVVLRLRPTHRSIWRAFLATIAWAALVTPVNLVLGTNYLFLMHKPERASLMDYFGPWPWYIPVLAMVGLTLFY